MVSKTLIIGLALMLGGTLALSQPHEMIYARTTYNTFSMSDIRNLQDELLSDLTSRGIPAKATDSYPAYFGFQFGVLVPLEVTENHTVLVGGLAEYTSTGGRVHYKDYSGEARADQVMHLISLGGTVDYRLPYSEVMDIDLQISAKYVISLLNNTFLLQVGSELQIQQPNFHASSFGIEPAIIPSIRFGRIRTGLSLSYMLFLPSSLEYDNLSNAYLVNKKGEKVFIDWTGARAGLIVDFTF